MLKQKCCPQGSSLEDAIKKSGGVPEALLKAFTLLLQDQTLDPALIAAAISPPAASELIDAIPEADPVVLHQVRCETFESARHDHTVMLRGHV